MRRSRFLLTGACIVLPCALLAQPSDEADRVHSLGPVEILGTTPLPGLTQRVDRYPGHVQRADDADIERARSSNLPDFMNQHLTGVTVNEVQGSPFQVDVNYRGHRLSPTLGTAQGLSAYLDGVRINEPFGDVMNWDMLPESAVASIALMPGSNPLYGLNTLGGALVLTTKSGLSHMGTEADISIGSFGRRRIDVGHGAQWGDGWHGYVSGTWFDEQGWRDQSPGRLANMFLKLGRQQGAAQWTVSYLLARSRLTGNGLLSQSLYDIDPRSGYTFADTTRNRSSLLNFSLRHGIGRDSEISAVAWLRRGRREGSNGDVDGFEGDALLNRSVASQSARGASLQWTRIAGRHQFAIGGDASASRIGYDQLTQSGYFDAGRIARPEPGAPLVQDVSLRGRSTQASLFAADVISIGLHTQVTASARWNRNRIANDLVRDDVSAAESFTYHKLNPAFGATYAFSESINVFANLSQGTRVPTALELGCADPDHPCVLPAGLQSDPYLRQVVARTGEAGFRARPLPRLELSAAVFRTVSQDDIVFVRSSVSQAGYFTNVGRTRRQGLELAAHWRQPGWLWHANYTFLAATYQSEGLLPGPLTTAMSPNPFKPGTPIAGLPRHVAKAGIDWQVTSTVGIGADLLVAASQVIAGNESGTHPELGRLAGYSVVNARASWLFASRWQAYLRVTNLFDRRYASFASGNLDIFPRGKALRPGESPASSRFLAPGTGRAISVGARYEWDL